MCVCVCVCLYLCVCVWGGGGAFPSNEPVMRIDYIFARGIKALSAETVKVVAADHYPITAEFEI